MQTASILNVRIEPHKKQLFYEKTKKIGLDASVVIRLFIDRFIEHNTPMQVSITDDIFDNLFNDNDVKDKLICLGSELDKIGF